MCARQRAQPTIQSSSARSRSASRFRPQRVVGAPTTSATGSSASGCQRIPGTSTGARRRRRRPARGRRRRRSSRPSASGGSASVSSTSMSGCAARRPARRAGTSVAAAEGYAASRTRPRRSVGEVGQLLLGHVQLDRQRVRAGEQHAAGLGELDARRPAQQQRAAGRALQRPQVLADCRLGPAQVPGGATDRPGPRHRAEDQQPLGVHRPTISARYGSSYEVGTSFDPGDRDHGAMQTIGLIGGLSWHSTVEYYRVINELVAERRGGHASARVALQSLDFAEVRDCQVRGDWAGAGRLLAEAGQRCEQSGADLVLICSNLMHRVADDVQAAIDIPLLHIADAVARAGPRVRLVAARRARRPVGDGGGLLRRPAGPRGPDRRRARPGGARRGGPDHLRRAHPRPRWRSARGRRTPASSAAARHRSQAVVLACTEIELLVRPELSAPGAGLDAHPRRGRRCDRARRPRF